MKWKQNATTVAGGNERGEKLNQFDHPHGTFINQHQQSIYVADWGNHRIMCWPPGSEEGRVVVGGNDEGEESNQLNCPTSFSFDFENNSYVVDSRNHRVPRFEVDKY